MIFAAEDNHEIQKPFNQSSDNNRCNHPQIGVIPNPNGLVLQVVQGAASNAAAHNLCLILHTQR